MVLRRIHQSHDQAVVQVFPKTFMDRMLLRGTTAEIYIEPGINREEVVQTQALAYQPGSREGKTTLILGAGNTSFLIPGDFLSKLFVEGHVVALKPNPVNDYLGPASCALFMERPEKVHIFVITLK